MNKYCSKCGKELEKDSKYCQSCGADQSDVSDKNLGSDSKKQKKKKLPVWAIVLIVIGCLFFMFILFLFVGDSTVEPSYDKNGKPVYIAEQDVEKLFSNADNYKGKFVDFTGKVFTDPEKDDGATAFQVFTDAENSQKDIFVYYKGNISIKSDDYVILTGYVQGTLDGENAFGGSVSAPIIVATKLEKSDYKTVVRPTIKEINYNNKTINQHGCIISVSKVEFAKNETRVYVKAENKSKSAFSIYGYSSTIVQGSKQYNQDSNYDANYDELQDELKSGVVSEGVLVFPAIEQKDFKLTIGGSSDDWDVDINDYVFKLEVK